MTDTKAKYNVLITSYLEPELVARIQQVDERLNVINDYDLISKPRYAADHYAPIQRTPEQEARWRELLGQADILFDFDYTHRQDLPELAPNVRWIQSTSAGIGQYVKRYDYDKRLAKARFTTASGVHAKPLAEFCIMSMLALNKGLPRMLADQQRKHWERYAGTDLDGRSLVIVGVGNIGSEVARLATAFGMRVSGVNAGPSRARLEKLYAPEVLHLALPEAENLVICAPHTPQTENMIGERELALMPAGALLINIGRGAVVNEPALIAALRSGHLRGAALDVFADEPLPQESPLWEMSNVLVCPHSASTSDRENARITDLFCENLRRFLAGEPLLNVLNVELMY